MSSPTSWMLELVHSECKGALRSLTKQTEKDPNSLFFMPGNVYVDPKITSCHKNQISDLKNGTITGKSSHILIASVTKSV